MNSGKGKKQFEKHLRIGVRFEGSGFVLLDGKPLPKLAEGSVADLVVAPESIKDESIRFSLTSEKSMNLLEKGATVMIGVSPNMIEDIFAEGLIPASALSIPSPYLFVAVVLNADLWLQVRGDQEARLSSCTCTITALGAKADSLNHAFTVISQAFETKRRSHSGNVFERAFAHDDSGALQTLDTFRLAATRSRKAVSR